MNELPNTETAIVPHQPSPVVAKEDGNVAVTALQPMDMPQCQEALKVWAKNKVHTLDTDVVELQAAYDHAKKNKWNIKVLRKHLTLATDRLEFYRKLFCALEAGFIIVPNFPVTLFAVRKEDEAKVENRWTYISYAPSLPTHEQVSDGLPVGEGEYKNPFPWVFERHRYKQTDGKEVVVSGGAWEKMDFPITMAKPEIMEATTEAMHLKIFDQFGILPAQHRKGVKVKGDPIIVAQIIGPKGATVTFMLAWHLDTRVL